MKDLNLSVLNAQAEMVKNVTRNSKQLNVLTAQLEKLINEGFPIERLPEINNNLWYYSVENCSVQELNIARRAFGRLKKYMTDVHDETHIIHSLIPASEEQRCGTIAFKTKPIQYNGNGRCKIKKMAHGEYLALVCDNK